ncbi:hypothetical protein DAPPUDRAFT_324599 [Daphnia pulex]|uniref:SLC12A transporter C-terminal domain-containing protein n=1 Tax=Daphnia pulex TaxID=6669 RepID=E9H272_DAPPU|nr:hypothetical protein DAPPUDRAFT_324599 [Daphnia pulex]|eukprot:EFX74115.1 hypothetical protein DAPPUDRAFT_324599 [Daphnia pulex]
MALLSRLNNYLNKNYSMVAFSSTDPVNASLPYTNEGRNIPRTLPMPRKEAVSAPMYMAWLETLIANMPPFLFVGGNQTSVFTFYA